MKFICRGKITAADDLVVTVPLNKREERRSARDRDGRL